MPAVHGAFVLAARTELGAAPPAWAWGPVWVALAPLGGLAAWLVWRRVDVGLERKRAALRLWGWQLLLGGLWPAALFAAHSPGLALAVMLALLVAVLLTLRAFLALQLQAARLLLPYALWLCWAAGWNADCFWFGHV